MSDDDDFGNFEESTPAVKRDDDDEFGDFGDAGDSSFTPASSTVPHISSPALPATGRDGSNLLDLPDDEFEAAAASAWHPPRTAGDAAPSPSSSAGTTVSTQAHELLLAQLRAMRLVPHGAPPDSIFGFCGIPIARDQPAAAVGAAAGGLPHAASSSKGAQLLGQVYTPVIRCNVIQQWCGSASEQRLLTSLGLWEIALQAHEWELEVAAAGARYHRRGNLFGAGSYSGSQAGGLDRCSVGSPQPSKDSPAGAQAEKSSHSMGGGGGMTPLGSGGRSGGG